MALEVKLLTEHYDKPEFQNLGGYERHGGYVTLAKAFKMEPNAIIEEVPSPDNSMRAVIFERDCGATTGFSTQVSVLPHGAKLPNEAGNVLIAGERGTVPGKGGGPEVHAEWTAPDKLMIRYNQEGEVFLKEERIGKIEVGYRGLGPVSHQN